MSKIKEFPEEDPDNARFDAILNQVRGILGEHFEVAVVMCSLEGQYGTSYHGFNMGNRFAIRGMVESYSCGELEYDADEGDD